MSSPSGRSTATLTPPCCLLDRSDLGAAFDLNIRLTGEVVKKDFAKRGSVDVHVVGVGGVAGEMGEIEGNLLASA